uniref:Putative secreted protein n=1 Tax=Ixodes ricinus TaxID=34613 RepID=A0A6B0V3A3_IXORI
MDLGGRRLLQLLQVFALLAQDEAVVLLGDLDAARGLRLEGPHDVSTSQGDVTLPARDQHCEREVAGGAHFDGGLGVPHDVRTDLGLLPQVPKALRARLAETTLLAWHMKDLGDDGRLDVHPLVPLSQAARAARHLGYGLLLGQRRKHLVVAEAPRAGRAGGGRGGAGRARLLRQGAPRIPTTSGGQRHRRALQVQVRIHCGWGLVQSQTVQRTVSVGAVL